MNPYTKSTFLVAVALLHSALLPANTWGRDSPLVFNLTAGPELQQLAAGRDAERRFVEDFLAGFDAAAAAWSAVLADPVTLNFTLDLDVDTLPAGAGGGALPEFVAHDYASVVHPALAADRASRNDALAVASLPSPRASGVEFITNDTTVIPSPRIRDADGSTNNMTLAMTRANAKALRLVPAADPGTDGTILITGNLPAGIHWDFDPRDGIGRRHVDFVGLAIHELGHQLGFVSGVDAVDTFGGDGVRPEGPLAGEHHDLNIQVLFLTLDLFRYTQDSLAHDQQPRGGLRDFAFGSPGADDVPFLSIDGGEMSLGTLSSGVFNGDGFQASHWQHDHGLGVMDPVVGIGNLRTISPLDIMVLDAIGWDLHPVPEPSGLAMIVAAMLTAACRGRVRSTRAWS